MGRASTAMANLLSLDPLMGVGSGSTGRMRDGDVFYLGKGSPYSAGFDGSWHTYSIIPNVDNGWDFVLDGQPVASFAAHWTHSKDAAYLVAEMATNSPHLGNLGPVEFADLSYLKEDGWHSVSSLTAIIACGVNTNCNVNNPYDVSLIGPNDVEAGSIPNFYGVHPTDGQLLWTLKPTLILQVPSQVQVTIDGVSQQPGMVQVTTSIGSHNVSVPSFVQLDAGTRLKFISWTAGSQVITDPNISIDLRSDERIEAIYVTQYKLTLVSSIEIGSSSFNYTSWTDWYDSGSTASFTASTPIIPMVFSGWYDETGNLVTTSQTGTIPMDGTHILEAQWQPNYPILGGGFILIIVLLAVISKLHSQIRSE